jgi:hypothetical protein
VTTHTRLVQNVDLGLVVQLRHTRRPRLETGLLAAVEDLVRQGAVAGHLTTRSGMEVDWWLDHDHVVERPSL